MNTEKIWMCQIQNFSSGNFYYFKDENATRNDLEQMRKRGEEIRALHPCLKRARIKIVRRYPRFIEENFVLNECRR